jgi:alpha-beta hydrolase superfamily lysophospholipase
MPRPLRVFTRALLRLILIAALTYAGLCAFVAAQKETIIFPLRGRERAALQTTPPGYESWWQTMRDGTRVEAWWRPAPGSSADKPAPAIIVFHGNGELIDDSRDFAEVWNELGASVLLVEYRGYGRSDGEPGINACKADSLEWFDRLAATPGVRSDLILAHGFSLGGVFAAELAAARPIAGLALEGTVASLRHAARDRHIWVLFTRERFDATTALRALAPGVPVLLTHGTRDDVVPFHHLGLLAAARPSATVATSDFGHYPLSTQERPELLRALIVQAAARRARPRRTRGLPHPRPNQQINPLRN